MKIFAIAAAALFSPAALNAAQLNGLSAADIRVTALEVPAPAMEPVAAEKCGHYSGVITDNMHIYAQASKSQLYTFADTEAEFNEFVAFWTPVIKKFGMRVLSTEYKNEFGVLRYESADGRVIRMFNGDRMNYDALSEASIKKEQHMLIEALEGQGMTPVAAFTIKNDIFRPTFNVYYLTRPEANYDHEVQLRQMKHGDDIAFDIVEGKVVVVERDAAFSLVYIGKLLGYKAKLAADEAGIQLKLDNYRKYLAENGKEFIGSLTQKLDEPFTVGETTYNYAVGIYFFQ